MRVEPRGCIVGLTVGFQGIGSETRRDRRNKTERGKEGWIKRQKRSITYPSGAGGALDPLGSARPHLSVIPGAAMGWAMDPAERWNRTVGVTYHSDNLNAGHREQGNYFYRSTQSHCNLLWPDSIEARS